MKHVHAEIIKALADDNTKSGAMKHSHLSAINVLEVRDDGTAHLHKVDA